MTKQLFTGLTLLFICASVVVAQKPVNGNGSVVSKVHDVGDFSKLDISGVFNVMLVQGNKEQVEIEADENLQELIMVSNTDGRLKIKTRDNINIKRFKRLEVTVTLKNISELKSSIVGRLESELLKLDELEFDNSSVGNVHLKLEAKKLEADLQVVGNVSLSGTIEEADINNSCVGKLEAFDLRVQKLSIDNNSVGKTEIYAAKELHIKSAGIGGLFYKGDAVIKDMDISGLGKVKKM